MSFVICSCKKCKKYHPSELQYFHDVVVITTAQLHSTKPELRFCAGSNPARGVSEIRDGEDLWQWSWLEIRLNAFHLSTIPQKQFIIIIIIFILRSSFKIHRNCTLAWQQKPPISNSQLHIKLIDTEKNVFLTQLYFYL